MTSTKFSLSVSNAALSGLLYDCCNCESDQIGFLTGKVSETMETVVTDTQEPSIEKQVVYDILSTLPLSTFSFYNAVGYVDQQQLEELVGNLKEPIVGWYVYRRNSLNSLCLRESMIDRQLRSIFTDSDNKHFIVGVVSEYKDENDSTVDIQYTFYTRDKNNLIPVKVDVDNLAKMGMNFKKSSSVIGRFDLFRQINLSDAYRVGIPKFIEHAQKKVAFMFQQLSSDLCDSEKEIIELKNELKKLQPELNNNCQYIKSRSSYNNLLDSSSINHDSTVNFELRNSAGKEKGELTISKYEDEPSFPGSQEF